MESQGFRLEISPVRAQHAYEESYVRNDGNVWVEIHWNLLAVTPVEMEPLWARVGSTSILGTAVTTLSTADTLIYLCLHGAKHRWVRLAWLADVAALVDRSPELEWEAVFDRALKWDYFAFSAWACCW
jgi:hypothetical protein